MFLRDGVVFVRTAIGELTANLWSTAEVVSHLNDAAQRFCSGGQNIEDVVELTTESQKQEYVLPARVDQITAVRIFSGSLLPLKFMQRNQLQIGGNQGGLPLACWLRRAITTITTQNQETGLTLDSNQQRVELRLILGLWPTPNEAYPLYVDYVSFALQLKNPFDVVPIPQQFKREWCAYAIARCFEKETNMAMANYWDQIHERGIQAFKEYSQSLGQEMAGPQWGGGDIGLEDTSSTSIILVDDTPGYINM